jgi:Mannosyl-glycoprotein endo-beta-N-acetylglucosaminidase
MALRSHLGVALVATIAAVALTGANAYAAPAPFPMPLDSGTRYVAQLAEARAELARAQPEVGRAQQQQRALAAQHEALRVEVDGLIAQEQAAAAQVQAARDRIAGVAATQYVEAGGGRVNAAIEVTLAADSLLDAGRNLHILEQAGTYELVRFEAAEAAHVAVSRQLHETTERRDDAKRDADDAVARVERLQASLAGARQRIAEAQDGIARFHRSATTAGSPIMGPALLSAGDLAAFMRAAGARPQITVSLDALAQMYIEEGQKVGVRGDVAFAQSIIETGWFGFERSMVEPSDNNFAGVGACDTCSRGFGFPDARSGIRAQMQLLRVYVDPNVTATSLGERLLLPGTLRLGFRGRVQTWWDLTGRWATASNYGNVIYGMYNRMVAASGRR